MTRDGLTEKVMETKTVRVGESLGNVVTSGYCSCSICCGQWAGGPTASGVYPTANHIIAVDASNPFVPIGTKVVMNGVEYTAEEARREFKPFEGTTQRGYPTQESAFINRRYCTYSRLRYNRTRI